MWQHLERERSVFWSRDWADASTSFGTPMTASNHRTVREGWAQSLSRHQPHWHPDFRLLASYAVNEYIYFLNYQKKKKKHCQDYLLSKRIPICVIGKHSQSYSDIENWAKKNWLNKSVKLLRPQDSNIHFITQLSKLIFTILSRFLLSKSLSRMILPNYMQWLWAESTL